MTLRQKNLLKNLGGSRTMEEAMLKANYAPSTAHQQSNVLKSPGFEVLLEQYLPDNTVLEVHKKALQATKIVSSHTEPDYEVDDFPTQLRAAELAYKVKGRLKDGLQVQGDVTMNVTIVRHADTA